MHSLGGGNEMRCYGDLEFPARPNMPLPWCIRVALVSGKRDDPDTLSAWFSFKERLRTTANQP